jgi:microsomal epoxide hydrolase
MLVPGWPESWYAYRKLMLALAKTYDVIAFDPPGLGDSDPSRTGYDTRTIAATLHVAMSRLNVRAPHYVMGHDVGNWIAYAYAEGNPSSVVKLVLLDAVLPGVTPDSVFNIGNAPKVFQFYFNSVPDLPEILARGREAQFLGWFFTTKVTVKNAISKADQQEYLRSYLQAPRMAAGFNYYRAVPQDVEQNRGVSLQVPVMALGGEGATKDSLVKALQAGPSPQATGGQIDGCGHYMMEECPSEVLSRTLAFFGPVPAQ